MMLLIVQREQPSMLKEEGVLFYYYYYYFKFSCCPLNSKGIRFCLKEKNKFQVEIHNKSNDTSHMTKWRMLLNLQLYSLFFIFKNPQLYGTQIQMEKQNGLLCSSNQYNGVISGLPSMKWKLLLRYATIHRPQTLHKSGLKSYC